MERLYSYDELASILGCTRTAIAKKVKPDEHNQGVERYKNRYKVVMNEGKKCILIDDEGLEEEKAKSKGFKNVSNSGVNTVETSDIIDIEPKNAEKQTDKVLEFTERYIERFVTLQEAMYTELRNRDNQILLLTTGEKTKEQEYFKATALNKELQSKYNVATKVIFGLVTLLIIVISSFITFAISNHNVLNVPDKNNQSGENISGTRTNISPVVSQVSKSTNISDQGKK